MKTKWRNSLFSRKYKARQEKLSCFIIWAAIAIAVYWFAWKKGIWDNIVRGLGLMEWEIPFFRSIYSIFFTAPVSVMLILFFILYLIWRSIWIFSKRKKKGYGVAYEYNNIEEVWLLKQEFIQVRSFYQYLLAVEIPLLVIITAIQERKGGFEEVFVMAVAIFLYTWEKFDYYFGYTAKEYQRLYTVPIAEEMIMPEKPEIGLSEIEKQLVEIQCSQDYKERCMGYYWYQRMADISEIYMDYIEASLQLVKRQSVYFSNVFYQDMGYYIFPFLNMELLDNKKILVVSGRHKEEKIIKWLSVGLQERSDAILFWTIENGQQELNKSDIAVVSFENMEKIPEHSYGFWYGVTVVCLLEPSCFIPCPLKLTRLLARIQQQEEKITYLICDKNGEGMADWLSHMVKEEIFAVNMVSTIREGAYSAIDVDRDETEEGYAHMPYFMPYAIKLTDKFGKEKKEKISWYGNRAAPVYDIGQEMQKYGIKEETFEFYTDGIEQKKEQAWNVVEDAIYNLHEVLRQYDTCGYQMAYTTVCSPHYMLRGFMLSHMDQVILPLAPEFICSGRNMAIAVGYSLANGNTDWEDSKKILEYYHANVEEPLSLILKRLNTIYRNILGLDKMWVTEDYFNWEEEPSRERKRVVISTEEGRQQFLRWYNENISIALSLKEGAGKKDELYQVMGGHVYQYYLPGQFVTLNGKYYRVEEIAYSEEKRLIKLRRASDSCRHRRYYRQVRNIQVEEVSQIPIFYFIQREDIQVELHYADIMVHTESNLCSSRFYDLKRADRIPANIPSRCYRKKAYLKISVNNQNGMWIGLLLKEMLYTFFPQCWQLFSVAVGEKWRKEEMIGRLDCITGIEIEKETYPVFYVIEDSPVDIGLVEAVGGKFETILAFINQYVDWGNREGKEEVREYFGDEILKGIRVFKEDSYVYNSGTWKSHSSV